MNNYVLISMKISYSVLLNITYTSNMNIAISRSNAVLFSYLSSLVWPTLEDGLANLGEDLLVGVKMDKSSKKSIEKTKDCW